MKILKNKQLKITFLAVFTIALITAGAFWYLNKGDVQGVHAGW
jgi:preprotein translocase subunit SecE